MDNNFLVGLARGDFENRNIDLIKTRAWIDIPMSTSTSPGDYRINKQFQMMKFDGTRWVLFGPILTDDFVGN